MGFLFVNTDELSALMGLPYIQQSAYLLGIRPYMDRSTFLVGVKRRISYQSLAEILYVEPHQGYEQSGTPSRQQLRRIIYALEKIGLIEVHSVEKQLILKCLLADADGSVQNKPDTNPAQQPDTKKTIQNPYNTVSYTKNRNKADTAENTKPDTPLKEDNYIYLFRQFEKFWNLYPLKKSQQKAWDVFKALNPSNDLLIQMQSALQQQIQHYQLQQCQGQWVAAWKYPANWLAQRCWEDEIQNDVNQEKNNEVHETSFKQQPVTDNFWESCKSGIEEQVDDNIIQFNAYRGTSKTY